MKTKTVFVCEECGFEYEYPNDALKCEAYHLGLSLEEYQEYLMLLRIEKQCGINVSIAKNEHTEKLFDDAVNAVVEFRKSHNIIGGNYEHKRN